MKKLLCTLGIFILLCFVNATALGSSAKVNLVWQPIVNEENDLSSIKKLAGVNVVSPSWFIIDTNDGHVADNSDFLYGQYAQKKGYKIWALITNDFDPEKTHKWLHNKKSRKYIINQMLFYAKRYPIDGYNFDFENIYDTDRDALSSFVEEATMALHKEGLVVSMDITIQSSMKNWSSCYDRQRLGKVLDYVILMAYDEHGRLSKTAGSVASINWVENGVRNLLQSVPADKMILGLPLYMRLWQEDNEGKVSATTLDMAGAEKLLKEKSAKRVWLKEQGQYYFTYVENGKQYKIWQEDKKSLSLKADLVKKYNLAGVASWRKGFEKQNIWGMLSRKLK